MLCHTHIYLRVRNLQLWTKGLILLVVLFGTLTKMLNCCVSIDVDGRWSQHVSARIESIALHNGIFEEKKNLAIVCDDGFLKVRRKLLLFRARPNPSGNERGRQCPFKGCVTMCCVGRFDALPHAIAWHNC